MPADEKPQSPAEIITRPFLWPLLLRREWIYIGYITYESNILAILCTLSFTFAFPGDAVSFVLQTALVHVEMKKKTSHCSLLITVLLSIRFSGKQERIGKPLSSKMHALGVLSQSPSVQSVYTELCRQIWQQQNHKICRWHHRDETNKQQWWEGL